MKNRFKPKDKLICIDDRRDFFLGSKEKADGLTKGNIYTVSRLSCDYAGQIHLVESEMSTTTWLEERFIKYSKLAEEIYK